jgi:hypothetical protein
MLKEINRDESHSRQVKSSLLLHLIYKITQSITMKPSSKEVSPSVALMRPPFLCTNISLLKEKNKTLVFWASETVPLLENLRLPGVLS